MFRLFETGARVKFEANLKGKFYCVRPLNTEY